MVTCAAGPRDLAGPGGGATIDRRMRRSEKGPTGFGLVAEAGRALRVVIEADGDPLDQVEGLFLPPPVSIREVRGGGPARLRSIRPKRTTLPGRGWRSVVLTLAGRQRSPGAGRRPPASSIEPPGTRAMTWRPTKP